MHKFIDNIVAFSLKNKFFIFFCTAIAVIAGAVSFKHTPIDAFPDVTNTKVTIITQCLKIVSMISQHVNRYIIY